MDAVYAERRDRRTSALDRAASRLAAPLARRLHARAVRPDALIRAVDAAASGMHALDERALLDAARALREPLRRHGFRDDLVARAFALVREAARRALGQRHYDVQLMGGRVLLAGMLAEMEAGEGKTLTATLAAATAALAGIPVHVVTVNDYLAARDADWMGPVYRVLGLSVGAVVQELDAGARRAAYACDVAYCSHKELAFDYLRDRLALGPGATRLRLQIERLAGGAARAQRLVLRGLHFAIVDEADGVLVDEARTPLVLSQRSDTGAERRTYEQALALAAQLEPDVHFTLDAPRRRIDLRAAGRARLDALVEPLGGVWRGRLRREELARQALVARHLLRRDTHYLVQPDGRVVLIDEATGRRTPDRALEQGLQQLLEVKEGGAPSGRSDTLARISHQRFFRRYLRLAGMTASAREVAGELWSVYRLAVYRVPTQRPLRRRALPMTVYARDDMRWGAVVARVAALHATGRPLLVGTRSVAASERLSRMLDAAGLPHRVLNARHDAAEAEIVARAGARGCITVATNLAGRGTDIRLDPGVADLGGLHVLATERHEARRIDRQLAGRSARQGDPGSHELMASLDDELVVHHAPRLRALANRTAGPDGSVPPWLARLLLRLAQRRAERLHARARVQLLELDDQLDATLAFAGRGE
jgi:preprotein translocase subunit SecA